MRGDHDFRQVEQGAVRARLGGEHVEARAPNVPGPDGVGQGLLVDEPTAGSVDNDLPLLGLRQQFGVEHAGGFRGFRQVNRNEVRTGHEFAKVSDQLHPELGGPGPIRIRVVRNDCGFECCEPLGE